MSDNVINIAGRLQYFIAEWELLTSDKQVLDTVRGCPIEFTNRPQQVFMRETKLNVKESLVLDEEIHKLLIKGVIEQAEHCAGDFISTVFLRPKCNGTYRMILNLKSLNESVEYIHFKMESLHSAIRLITPGCFMASIDLKDAYYTVNVSRNFRKFLRFIWRGQLYQFTCLPNGLGSAPRKFTKLLKPVFSTLRDKGFTSVVYLDDTYLQGNTYEECFDNITATKELLLRVGFVINYEKSVLIPTQELVFLGFILNSVSMTISLTPEKVQTLTNAIWKVQSAKQYIIRQVAELIGIMISYSIAIPYGLLHTKILEHDKTLALKQHKGNFDALMVLSAESVCDLEWWLQAIKDKKCSAPLYRESPTITLTTDASSKGWGAVCNNKSTGGQWKEDEVIYKDNINYLELHAVLLGLKAFINFLQNRHVKVKIDNSTAVAYINNMGGTHSMLCNGVARKILMFGNEHNIWLTAEHVPGKDNYLADRESRIFHDNTEWMLSKPVFTRIAEQFFVPDIDLFASRLNHQVKNYISWRPDPGALLVDAFTCDWSKYKFYAFPPFSQIDKVLQKVAQDSAEGLLLVPDWKTQLWYPVLMNMCVQPPRRIPAQTRLLILPYAQDKVHPLHQKLRLLVCHVSGTNTSAKVYQTMPLLL